MPSWPASLPDFYDVHALAMSFGEGRRFTATDDGAVQVSRRSSATRDRVVVSQTYDDTQLAALRTFYKDTLKEGTLSFDHLDPVDGAAADYRFAPDRPPPSAERIRGASGSHWSVSFILEKLP